MSRPTLFVVLTSPRSGSSWLIDLLNHHPAVTAYAELFRPGESTVSEYGASELPRFEVFAHPGTYSVSKQLVRRRYQYVRGLVRAHRDAHAVGFKLMYDQTRYHPGLLSALVLRRAKFVHLVRRNALGAVVSFDLAERRDGWWYRDGDEIPRTRVRVEPGELIRRLEEREHEVDGFRARLRRLPVRVLEISYEDLLERRSEFLPQVLRFLDVAPAETTLRSSLVRASPERLAQAVENYEELETALSGTRFSSMLAKAS